MNKINAQLLHNDWIHSHEEDTDHAMVYRPSTYKLRPARGRTTLSLKPGGDLVAGGPGADDRHVQNESSWKLDKDVLILHDQEPNPTKMKVLSVAADKLVFAK